VRNGREGGQETPRRLLLPRASKLLDYALDYALDHALEQGLARTRGKLLVPRYRRPPIDMASGQAPSISKATRLQSAVNRAVNIPYFQYSLAHIELEVRRSVSVSQ
jgi:hypothetical protein